MDSTELYRQLLGVTSPWTVERVVMRGRAAKADAMPQVIGVDEKAIAKGHRYMTLVCDPWRSPRNPLSGRA